MFDGVISLRVAVGKDPCSEFGKAKGQTARTDLAISHTNMDLFSFLHKRQLQNW
jgi:hypothetical protein